MEANNGLRRLITSQGNELVEEVSKILRTIGFQVDLIDNQIGQNEPKKEDLRLKCDDVDGEEWAAIVEVERIFTK